MTRQPQPCIMFLGVKCEGNRRSYEQIATGLGYVVAQWVDPCVKVIVLGPDTNDSERCLASWATTAGIRVTDLDSWIESLDAEPELQLDPDYDAWADQMAEAEPVDWDAPDMRTCDADFGARGDAEVGIERNIDRAQVAAFVTMSPEEFQSSIDRFAEWVPLKNECGTCLHYSMCRKEGACIRGASARLLDDRSKATNPKDAVGVRKWRQFTTVPQTVLVEVGAAMLEGARKYGRHNYRVAGVRASVYIDAAFGHMMSYWEGEDIDPDSGLPHVVKAIASLVVVRDAMIQNMLTDDRPPRVDLAAFRARMQAVIDDLFERYPDPVPAYTEIEHGQSETR